MSDYSAGTSDAGAMKAMFAGGLENVRKQTEAQKGDKTMMDALILAVEAMASTSQDIKELLVAAAEAAFARPNLQFR